MQHAQQLVQAFHDAFNLGSAETPTIPSVREQRLRLDLFKEELQELDDAFVAGDIVEVADALGDLLYVVLGTGIVCGIELDPVFAEVHRSNMSKVGGHKGPNGKWVKPATYDPPKLESIILRQGRAGKERA